MAEVAGKGGSITCTNLDAGVKAWNLSLVGDALEVTDYSDAGVRTYIVGCTGWSGSCEVNWDAANDGLVHGATITGLIFTVVDGTTYYTGATAIVTGISVGSAVGDVVSMSVTFQGSGTCILSTPA